MHFSVTSSSGTIGDCNKFPSLTTELRLAPTDLTDGPAVDQDEKQLSLAASGGLLAACTWLCDRCWPSWESTGKGFHGLLSQALEVATGKAQGHQLGDRALGSLGELRCRSGYLFFLPLLKDGMLQEKA